MRLVCSAFMVLFTFIVSPILATAFSDSSCFLYVITGLSPVSSTFQAKQYQCTLRCDAVFCHLFCGFTSIGVAPLAMTVVPSWLYSYQCSSAILTNYVPVLTFVYLWSGVVVPLCHLMYFSASAEWVELWIPGFIRESLLHNSMFMYRVVDAVDLEADRNMSPTKIKRKYMRRRIRKDMKKAAKKREFKEFNSIHMLSKILMNVTALLTFGLASPLLALLIIIDLISMEVIVKLTMLRFLSLHRERGQSHLMRACARLEASVAGVVAGVSGVVVNMLFVVVLFWSMFMFDMMGDVYGAEIGGVTVAIFIIVLMVLSVTLLLFKSRAAALDAIRQVVTLPWGTEMTSMEVVMTPGDVNQQF